MTAPKRPSGSAKQPRSSRGARLGQHFLTRPEIAGWVADAAALTPDSTVLEIGPGHGILTRELCERALRVIAIEKDPQLAAELRGSFSQEIATGQLTIKAEDIRDFDPYSLHPTPYVLAANIPYYISGYIVRKFLTTRHQPHTIAILVQKEVADRIVARDGKESLLSLSVKAYGTPSYVRTVKPGAFNPPPAVESAVLRIDHISRAHFDNTQEEDLFFSLLHQGFGAKRKQIGNTLAIHEGVAERCGIDLRSRPEAMHLAAWLCLTKEMCHYPVDLPVSRLR